MSPILCVLKTHTRHDITNTPGPIEESFTESGREPNPYSILSENHYAFEKQGGDR